MVIYTQAAAKALLPIEMLVGAAAAGDLLHFS